MTRQLMRSVLKLSVSMRLSWTEMMSRNFWEHSEMRERRKANRQLSSLKHSRVKASRTLRIRSIKIRDFIVFNTLRIGHHYTDKNCPDEIACCKDNWHGKPVPIETIRAIEACIKDKAGKGKLPIKKPINDAPAVDLRVGSIKIEPPSYKKGEKVATRAAYGTALAKLGDACPRIIGLDGDTKNSTYSEKLLKKHPEQFIECFIAEQNLVGVAIGAACRARTIPFTSTFAAFFMRATDHLRMGAVSFANIKCAGSHVGVSIGEDGPSQMALEDLAVFRAIPSSTVFYPSDGVATERATELAANIPGIVFIRTGRPANPIIYDNNEHFEVGKGKVVRESASDKILLIGAGVTLFECLKAADTLAGEGVHACVIDPFTIKPLDKELIIKHAKRVGGRVLTVEDHYPAGGIGEAVCRSVADEPGVRVRSLCVTGVPRSGPPDGLLDMFGISAKKIVAAVHEFH
uniref:transketolase n=1 Tax=Ascaris suum TaxID=6253 RepID=F1KW42_ASCSU